MPRKNGKPSTAEKRAAEARRHEKAAAVLKRAKLVQPGDKFPPLPEKASLISRTIEILSNKQQESLKKGEPIPLLRILGHVKETHISLGGRFIDTSTNHIYNCGPTKQDPRFLVPLPEEFLENERRGRYVVVSVPLKDFDAGLMPFKGTISRIFNANQVTSHPAIKSLPRYTGKGKARRLVTESGGSSSSASAGASMKAKPSMKAAASVKKPRMKKK